MLRSWHKFSNLRGLFFKQSCPEVVKDCLSLFETLVRPQTRGVLAVEQGEATMFSDSDEQETFNESSSEVKGKLVALPPRFADAFRRARPDHVVPSHALMRSHVRHIGLSYTTESRHRGNSSVILRSIPAPFIIEQIIEFPETGLTITSVGQVKPQMQGTWIVGLHHLPSDIVHDPYAAWPELGASVWSARTDTQLKAAMVSDIEVHCARMEWDEYIAVVSTRRVSVSSISVFFYGVYLLQT